MRNQFAHQQEFTIRENYRLADTCVLLCEHLDFQNDHNLYQELKKIYHHSRISLINLPS